MANAGLAVTLPPRKKSRRSRSTTEAATLKLKRGRFV
jgi:hypothetical protein